ncbi:pirin family protein [Scandinavium sp. V105_16]|uniref:Pirin family protein n=1 Tax=Scandinavium lactucae TaxID=3095028 RepID=A0AAJ2S4T6_9ENTR|nr:MULTISPECIES: pirin family protein [unclassified Scandinavium]MDX6018904.1 pirin family protein [Scandinavium sp. V105_16]MDX6030134.1 pirin family protein [Scandinavium sp. V105_12]MDX6039198.1 pirin family protein [Scandinavium sp. V105_6]MDX6050269.1 pirin family protein [Scandinavium sp. V105_1]
MKSILGVYSAPKSHWVGDGFPVRSLFSYAKFAQQLSPFLLLDYAGPAEFKPSNKGQRGVDVHPHRGFETVTIVYKGEVAHRDSTGSGGVIGPGDVQWMTAGSGILHEEFHSPAFSERGGTLEMVQLWVNLPAKDKSTPPAYQSIVDGDIPQVTLADNAGLARVIAGELDGHKGPARTFSPMRILDLRLNPHGLTTLNLPDGWNTALVVLKGTVQVNNQEVAREAQLVVLDAKGENVTIEANNDAVVLVLSGEPLNEPVEGYGPFVMNTREEINQAIDDFNAGRFGQTVA